MLVVAQGGALAGGAGGDQAVHALDDLALDQAGIGLLVERAAAHRGDQRRERASELRLGHG
jgi:hypothetical protein